MDVRFVRPRRFRLRASAVSARPVRVALSLLVVPLAFARPARSADEWPRWRGPDGAGVSEGRRLPEDWSRERGVVWSAPVPGEGASSPVVSQGRIFVTSAHDEGLRREIHALDFASGELLWTRTIEDDDPELTSAVTGHAASTPATDGRRVVACFGAAGVVCVSAAGDLEWRAELGELESELGFASSPVIHGDRVVVVSDHDGRAPRSFDSYLVAYALESGEALWKTPRPGLFRSWSTPIVLPARDGASPTLVVSAQDEVRAYGVGDGALRWTVGGLTGWVTPSPVFDGERVYVTSGKRGPVLAIEPGGDGGTAAASVAWRHERDGAYVVSPLVHDGRVWVMHESGILDVYRASDGERLSRTRLDGRFTASPVAGDGKVYYPAESGVTYVLRSSDEPRVIARPSLDEYTVSSPAVVEGDLVLRTETRVWRVEGRARAAERRAATWLAERVITWPEKNGCVSCHDSGDALRAVAAARAAGHATLGDDAFVEAARFLRAPERWTEDERVERYGDPFLVHLQFGSALLGALPAALREAPLREAAELIATAQLDDGSWPGGATSSVGSPTAWSAPLATWMATRVLCEVTEPSPSIRASLARARAWLAAREPRNVHQAAVRLLALEGREEEADAGIERSFAIIRAGRSKEGGWGPYTNARPEPFDTALVLLALARARERDDAPGRPDVGELESWLREGRRYLIDAQEPDGAWPATTRPPGDDSHAQRVSTSAWVLLALLNAG